MRFLFKFTLVVLFSLKLSLICIAQDSVEKLDREKFIWEIKQIEEFIERFNSDSSTLFLRYISEKGMQISRKDLIKSLFKVPTDINFNVAKRFISEVTNKKDEKFISFTDTNWYASLKCNVIYKGERHKADLKLKIFNNGSLEWIIFDAHAPFLKNQLSSKDAKFINPASSGTDFMELKQLFRDTNSIGSIIDFSKLDDFTLFMLNLQNGDIKLDSIFDIRYVFQNIPGWSFTVEKFTDSSNYKQRGWLISDLQLTNNPEGFLQN